MDDSELVLAIRSLTEEVTELRLLCEGMAVSMHGMAGEIATLNRLVRDGNGKPGLVAVQAEHSKSIKYLEESVEEIEEGIEQRRGQAALWLLGLFGAIVMSIWTFVLDAIRDR